MGIGAQELAKLARIRICAGCGCVTLCHVSTAISGIVQPHLKNVRVIDAIGVAAQSTESEIQRWKARFGIGSKSVLTRAEMSYEVKVGARAVGCHGD